MQTGVRWVQREGSLMNFIKNTVKRIVDIIVRYIRLRNLNNKRPELLNCDFTIIANNCVGGVMYKDLGLRALSPTINLFLVAPDYIKFLSNLDHYLSEEPKEIKQSKYYNCSYPIGLLDDIELHFVHYITFEEAKAKWEERKERINKDNLFVIGSDRDFCSPLIIKAFDELPYKNKIFLSSQPYPDLKSVVWLKEYQNYEQIPDIIPNRALLKYVDIIEWLNNSKSNK